MDQETSRVTPMEYDSLRLPCLSPLGIAFALAHAMALVRFMRKHRGYSPDNALAAARDRLGNRNFLLSATSQWHPSNV
jgi:hypothetical protein